MFGQWPSVKLWLAYFFDRKAEQERRSRKMHCLEGDYIGMKRAYPGHIVHCGNIRDGDAWEIELWESAMMVNNYQNLDGGGISKYTLHNAPQLCHSETKYN